MPALLIVLIWLIVAGVIFSILWWLISTIGLPEPFLPVAKAILAIAAAIILIYMMLSVLPPLPIWK